MKDWKGNDIKAGDTIVFVRTTPMFKNLGWMIPKGKGEFDFYKSEIQPPEHCWEPSEYQTKEHEGKLFYGSKEKASDGLNYWMILDDFTINFWLQPHTVICIKGVSDSEEEYYKEYFKVNG